MMEPFKPQVCFFCHKQAHDYVLSQVGDTVIYVCIFCDDRADVPEDSEAEQYA